MDSRREKRHCIVQTVSYLQRFRTVLSIPVWTYRFWNPSSTVLNFPNKLCMKKLGSFFSSDEFIMQAQERTSWCILSLGEWTLLRQGRPRCVNTGDESEDAVRRSGVTWTSVAVRSIISNERLHLGSSNGCHGHKRGREERVSYVECNYSDRARQNVREALYSGGNVSAERMP